MTPGSFLLSLCHTHTQLAHTLMYTRRKCSSVICLFLLSLPLPSLLECSIQVLLEHPPLVWLRVPCEYCCSIHRSTDGVSLEILLEYPCKYCCDIPWKNISLRDGSHVLWVTCHVSALAIQICSPIFYLDEGETENNWHAVPKCVHKLLKGLRSFPDHPQCFWFLLPPWKHLRIGLIPENVFLQYFLFKVIQWNWIPFLCTKDHCRMKR